MHYEYQNLYEALSKSATHKPNSVAIFDNDKKITYKKFKTDVDKVACYLQELGIGFGDKVALCVSNSSEFIISYYAITAIGAVAVPLNTFLKFEEIEFILKDCAAQTLIVSSNLSKEIIKADEIETLSYIIWIDEIPKSLSEKQDKQEVSDDCVDSVYLLSQSQTQNKNICFDEALKTDGNLKIPKSPKLDDLLHIIYTSGTTGKPKGAMISYKNVLSNLNGANERFGLKNSDRFIVFLPMFHSFTLTVMVLLPLYHSTSLIIVRSVFPFSNVLKQALLKQATIFLGIPAIYTAIGKAKIPWYFRWFNRIRLFICGAAPLAKQTLDDFKVKFPRATLIEGYGLSECSPIVASNLLQKQKPMSVGTPFPTYKVKIVDDEMVEKKCGEIGEIIVQGDCVMQGYLGQVAVTDETIVNGWLRTGDLGYVDEEGFIYIVDRKKDLIISKGINIYPREIEEVIYKLEEVEATAVIGIKDEHADEEVVAFIKFKDGLSLSDKEIKSYLKKHLANFKIPKSIYFRDELPTNATGKVLKRVLKEQIKA